MHESFSINIHNSVIKINKDIKLMRLILSNRQGFDSPETNLCNQQSKTMHG